MKIRPLAFVLCLAGCSPAVDVPDAAVVNQAAAFVTETGALIRSEPKAVLFVKHTPPAAKVCGGIGTWGVSAAQVGGSYIVDAKAVVFDPIKHRVWMPR